MNTKPMNTNGTTTAEAQPPDLSTTAERKLRYAESKLRESRAVLAMVNDELLNVSDRVEDGASSGDDLRRTSEAKNLRELASALRLSLSAVDAAREDVECLLPPV